MLQRPLDVLVFVPHDFHVGMVRGQSGEGRAGVDGGHGALLMDDPVGDTTAVVGSVWRSGGKRGGGGGTKAEGGDGSELCGGGCLGGGRSEGQLLEEHRGGGGGHG